MKKQIGYILLLTALLTGCGNGNPKQNGKTMPPVFPRVEAPVTMTDPKITANYFAEHYWDKFDFRDTLFLTHPDVLEQALVDYVVVLPYADIDQARKSISRLIGQTRADTAMFRFFREKTEHYLWDPNSPYRNEELYIPVLETMLASDELDMATRARAEYRLATALKNRPGTVATDFMFALESGQKRKMSQIQAEYLLLFFNNPECSTCAEIIAHIQNSPLMNALQRDERLTVLAVYTDEDLPKWRSYQTHMPAEWINSYNPDSVIKNEKLYDLKAIPSLYLLDADKTILLKDADIRVIEAYLQENALKTKP